MTPRRILIQLMTTTFPILNPLIQHSNKIINTRTINNHQILHKKSICCIPSAVEDSWWRVEEITDLLVVDFGKGGFYWVFLFFCLGVFPRLGDFLPDVFYCAGYDTVGLVGLEYLLAEFILDAGHCICFSTTGLSISKNGNRIPI